jgi:hypothetical protein
MARKGGSSDPPSLFLGESDGASSDAAVRRAGRTKESRGLEVPETEEQRRWLSDFASWLVSTQAAQEAAAVDERRGGVRADSRRS